MSDEEESATEYLALSRGQWDPSCSREEIQRAIDEFYVWIERMVEDGKMKRGRRLAVPGKLVSKGVVTDGPYSEAKEVIGGYWFIVAKSLDAAAQLAAGNPCQRLGLSYEIRPIDPERASAYNVTSETPEQRRNGT